MNRRPFDTLWGVWAVGALLVGCTPAAPKEVTWHRDVGPIIQRNCQGCHSAGGIAPLALETYAQAQSLHTAIAAAVESRRMPPWLPDDSCQEYQGSRRLTQAEVDTVVAWSKGGAPEGNPEDAPAPTPRQPQTLPWVDVTLDPGVDYLSSAPRVDDYRCLVLDPQLQQDRDVIGYEVVPGERSVVHHVLLYAAPRAEAQAKDSAEAGPGWTCYGGPSTTTQRLLGGWVPGSDATRLPDTTGVRLKAGEVVVMQIHYNTSSGARPDRTRLRLQYSPQPVQNLATLVSLSQTQFEIPPRSTGYTVGRELSTSTFSPKVYGVLPHMHTLGKSIRMASSSGQCFVNIPRWDFHWQQFFFFNQPVQLQPRTQVSVRCTWDNPRDTPVRWGEGTEDEMCLGYFYVTGLPQP